MSDTLLAEFEALEQPEKAILALLALVGDPVGRTAVLDHMVAAGINDTNGQPFTTLTLDDPLLKLERLAFTTAVMGRGYVCNARLRWPAIRAAIGAHLLDDICKAYESLNPMRQSWNGAYEPRSYRHGVARLRMAMLRGRPPQDVMPLLAACMVCYEAAQLHPIVDIFSRPFEAGMLLLVHPALQDDVLMLLVQHTQREPGWRHWYAAMRSATCSGARRRNRKPARHCAWRWRNTRSCAAGWPMPCATWKGWTVRWHSVSPALCWCCAAT